MKNSFGASDASLVLEQIIETQHPNLSKKIGLLLSRYFLGFKNFERIEDTRTKKYMAILWRDDFLKKVTFDEETNAFLKNVLIAKYRRFIKEKT
jgi:hypothetical protein